MEMTTKFDQDLHLILENSFDSSWILDYSDYRLKYVNKEPTERLLGYAIESFYKDSLFWLSIVHPDDKHLALKCNEDCLANGIAESTYRMIHSNGQTLWIMNRQKLIKDTTGKLVSIVASSIDVTSIYSISEKLVISNFELDSYFSLSQELLCIFGLDGYFKKVNPAFQKTLGYCIEDLYSQPFIEFVHPEDKENTLRELRKGEFMPVFENRYRCRNNEYKIISWRPSSVTKEGLIYCAGSDVTEYRMNLNTLDRANKLLETTQSTTHVGGWEIEFPTHTVYWTRETYLIHDTTPEEYTPTLEAAINLYAPEHVPIISQALQEAIEHGKSFDIELEIITLKNRRIWVKAKGKPHFEDGKIIKIIGIFQDITEEKKVALEKMEQKTKLIASAKMSSLGEMAGGIAHEINNPLAIIIGSISVMKSVINSPQPDLKVVREQIENINFTTNRIVKIIKGLQTFSRNSDNDRMEVEILNDIIAETVAFCRERFKHHSIDLRLELDQINNHRIRCRSTQISQVLLNLLNNSFDAISSQSTKWVELQTIVYDKVIAVHVTDSGPGIPDEVAHRILEPFYSTKDVGKGTGLGLSISKGIIDDHRGSLYYDKNCKNTRFVVELPLTKG